MAGAFESIASVTVTSTNATTITFSSIPTTYKDLHIRGVSRVDTASITGWWKMGLTFNNTRASNTYAWQQILTTNGSNTSEYESYANPDAFYFPYSPTSFNPSQQFAFYTLDIFNYNNTSAKKAIKHFAVTCDTSGTNSVFMYANGQFNSTAAITRFDFVTVGGVNAISQGCTFDLYGVG